MKQRTPKMYGTGNVCARSWYRHTIVSVDAEAQFEEDLAIALAEEVTVEELETVSA